MFANSRISLITPNEVKKFSPSDAHDNTSIREVFIQNKEEKLFNIYFGWEFYEALIADKIDYETLPSYVGDYSATTAYTAGQTVQFVDELFTLIVANSTGIAPTNKVNWTRAKKFTNDDYNFLWERYLRNILAFNVLYTSVLYSAIQVTAKGVIKTKSDTFDSVSLKELHSYKDGVKLDIEDICYNMDLFIQRNPLKYPLYKPLIKNECGTKKKKRYNNFGFNVGGSKYAERPDLDEL